jgi:uncharacterized protein (DUF433 family)
VIHGVLVHDDIIDRAIVSSDTGVPVIALLDQLGQGRHVAELLAEHPSLTRGDLLRALNLVAATADR